MKHALEFFKEKYISKNFGLMPTETD